MYTEGDVSLVVKIKNFRTISPTTKEGKKNRKCSIRNELKYLVSVVFASRD